MPVLIVATTNLKKAEELKALLPELRIETLRDRPDVEVPEETGSTFAENARIKAEAISRRLGVAALADDSGLCVDALDGGPGVRSARYAEGSDSDRVRKLLAALEGVPVERRGAHFACAIAFAVPGREPILVEGRVDGRIIETPRGGSGFGYDPIFLVDGGPRTMAELSMAEKNLVSHRARALAAIRPVLARYFFP